MVLFLPIEGEECNTIGPRDIVKFNVIIVGCRTGLFGRVQCCGFLVIRVCVLFVCRKFMFRLWRSSLSISFCRYDGLFGCYGREAGFLLQVSIASSSSAGTHNSLSLRWTPVASAVCVCSFYVPRVGNNIDARVAFWHSLRNSTQRVSQRYTRCSLFLVGDSNNLVFLYSSFRVRAEDLLGAYCEASSPGDPEHG